MENKKISVIGQNHHTFLSRMEDMNKRLAKRNLPLINYKLIEERKVEINESVPVPYDPFVIEVPNCYYYYDYELSSDFDQKNIAGVDVQFEGVVDLIEKDENAKVFKIANSNLFKYLDNCQCDECKKSIGRNKYFVFSKIGKPVESRNDLVVLGSSCAKNYFPFDLMGYVGNLETFFVELFGDCDDSMGFGFHDSNYVYIRQLFHYVGACTDDFKVYEKENITRTHVECLIKGKKDNSLIYTEPKTKWEDMSQWLIDAYGDINKCKSEFEMNIHSVMFEPQTESNPEIKFRNDIAMKYLGIACYAFVGAKKAHDKELERQAREKMYKDGVNNDYFGEIGEKFEKELMFEKIIGFEGYYGYTYLLFFRDEEGRVYKWSSSNGSYEGFFKKSLRHGTCDYEVGKKYFMKGSIKDHSEYKGIKQTVITRCKVLKDEYESHIFDKKEIIKILEEAEKNKEPVDTSDDFDVFDIA